MITTIKPASPKSVAYLASLIGVPKDDNYAEWSLAMEEMGQKHVSAMIDQAKALPKVQKAAKGEWHVFEAKFYLVAMSQGSGNLYAKRRCDGGGFEFAPGIVGKLNTDTKVNASNIAEIAAYGHLHSQCVFCSLPLDLPESRLAGYGKKCSENYGLPWGNH